MSTPLHFPAFDPVIFHVGPLAVRWYGLMYLIGFFAAMYLANRRADRPNSGWTRQEVSDLLFYGFLGVVVGGRIGYVLFYHFDLFLDNPLYLFRVDQGGMSFHGGLLGVIAAMAYFARKTKRTFLTIGDFVAPLVPIGLGMGRLGNFINGELWGRPTDLPWAMVFPSGGPVARHPSQLYEALLEGLVLFSILWWFSAKPRARGSISGLFLVLYGCFRSLVEFVREPDPQLGELGGFITMGQLLSLPMILGGIALITWSLKKGAKA
ncbi:prolipoprotein diacylglyceryl transferase [Gallaecimonas xiamenensis]|uniref:Phosphatidylglycerol--prolipoprotein diacylglyceryl transferase n=1 Tax=Gallaecimonas xiamenensis 3-C-1 TaxID=745411 RepID=K2IE48_9GAMM|nr:prolipoprotein diacylglyceryl transferase [Gallaecimonas xiamenensis]EKE68286.1 prolipoprotein diacylglyceryl transferase [Gallaecimonas xiamenensis 3-C-1]